MNRDEIKKQIDEYIKRDKIKRAFYLTGDWGVGKTTFIRDYICKDLASESKKQYKSIYISLNGLTSISDIKTKIIKEEHQDLNAILSSKLVKIFAKLAKKAVTKKELVGDAAANVADVVESAKLTLSDFYDIQSNLIVFDDIERCLVKIESLFGFFDSLIENNIKLIIIGNEKEILNFQAQNYRSINKLVSSIALPKDDPNKFIENLEDMVDKFDDPISYKVIKEKVVAFTTILDFDKNIFFDQMVSSFKNAKIKKYVFEYKNDISNALNIADCTNLRDCDTYLIYLEAVINAVGAKEFSKLDNKNIKEIILNILISVISSSKNYEQEKTIDIFKKLNISLYPSLYNYCIKHNLDVNKLKMDINTNKPVVVQTTCNNNYKHLDALNEYWLGMEIEEIKENINLLKDDFNNDCFKIKDYLRVLTCFCLYKYYYKIDTSFDVETILKDMIEKIESSEEEIDLNIDFAYMNQGASYSFITNKLIKAINDKQNKAKIEKLNSLVFVDNFDIDKKSLEFECHELSGFLEFVDIEKMISKIQSAKNIGLIYLSDTLSYIYESINIFDFYKNEVDSLQKLSDSLANIEIQDDCIKKLNIKALKDNVDKFLDRAKNN